MEATQILFSPSVNWLIILVAGIAVAAMIWGSYNSLRGSLGRGMRLGLAAAKLGVVLLIMLSLTQPVASLERRLTGQGIVAVLVDSSSSMAVADSLGGRSRIDASLGLLGQEGRLLGKLEDDYTVELFRFDESLREIGKGDLSDLPTGLRDSTALLSSLSSLSSLKAGENLAAVVLISDGRENSAGADWNSVRDLGVPVFTVGVGTNFIREKGFVNTAILSVDSPRNAYLNNNVSITVSVGAFSVPETVKFARLELMLGDKRVAPAKDFKMPASGTIERVVIEFVPDSIGFHKYQLKLTPVAEEAVLQDNERDLWLDVREPRLRVLYVEGVLRPEYGFIRTTLTSDPDVKITSMVRTRKDSFLLQGEGVKVDLSRGLPDRAEDFKEFDVVILGDVPAVAFRDYQLNQLREWIEKGGGLIALGGHNSFSHGGWRESPLAQVYPVTMTSADVQVDKPMVFTVQPSGKQHPIFRNLEFASSAVRAGKGALGGCTAPGGVKSGAQVLAIGKDADGKSHTIMAVHKFGSGRVASFTADTTGKSHRELLGHGISSPWEKFWSQTIRWLAGFDEIRKEKDIYLKLSMDSRFVAVGENAVLNTEIVDTKKALKTPPSVQVSVTAPDEESTKLSHTLDNSTLMGQTEFRPDSTGLYTFRGELSGSGASDATEYVFLAGQPWLENSNLSLDEESLKLLARSSGGKYYNIVTASNIPDDIAVTRGRGVERVTLSLWNNPVVFLLLLGLLCLEWVLRRRRQLL